MVTKRKEHKKIQFWESMTLEELAREQGITPVNDPEEIAALWPDDDPDALLQYILNERKKRRRAA